MIDENGLEVGNDGQHTHYWTREDHEGKSVIDLTLTNRALLTWFNLAGYHATRSDNEVFEWEVEADSQAGADHERVVGNIFAAIAKEDPEAAEKLCAELWKEESSSGPRMHRRRGGTVGRMVSGSSKQCA